MEIEEDNEKKNLLRLLPPVLRARDFHLYLEGGRRLVDLWLYGGRAILGHKPPNTIRELKNSSERGLFIPFPNVFEKRFIKALEKLFPSTAGEARRRFRIYNSKASLASALEKQGVSINESVVDPAFIFRQDSAQDIADKESSRISLWRPFLGKTISRPLMIPVLPWSLAPQTLVLDETTDEGFGEGDIVSPVILAPAARAIHDLIAAEAVRSKITFSKIKKILSAPESKWLRQGIYLSRRPDDYGNWNNLWKLFLENGFLLPPDPHEPFILPGTLSSGEEAKLAELLLEP